MSPWVSVCLEGSNLKDISQAHGFLCHILLSIHGYLDLVVRSNRESMPRWAPDSKTLLFMSNKGDAANILTISPFAEVRPERVTADADSVMYGIANWSPDGREVVFVSDRAGTRDLWVISADGSARQVTSGPAQDWDPSFSPDGKQISYNSAETGHGGDTNLWTVNVSGEDARPLTTESLGDYGPRWSPDGRWIAFGSLRTGTWAIWVVPSTGGTPVQVPMRGYRAFMPCWSPDSKRIAFQAGSTTGNLLTIPATGGEPTVVAEGVYARYGTRASWSPDGFGDRIHAAREI